jgi:DNA-binding NtrC family response regulator
MALAHDQLGGAMIFAAGDSDRNTPRPPTVLVVEDEPLIRMDLAEHLREAGYLVIEVGTADQAMSVLSSGSKVHVVFSDVELPGTMGGFSLAVWIRNNHRFLPVILTSGVGSVIPPLSGQHVVPFLQKPYRPEEAAALIATVLSPSPAAQKSESQT